MDDDDYFLEAIKLREARLLNGYFSAAEPEARPEPPADTHMSGIHHEPKPGVVRALGNRFIGPGYTYVRGKRVSTRKSRNFGL